MGNFIDITGNKYGYIKVLKLCDERNGRNQIQWECICDCGERLKVITASLKNGNTTSCGCRRAESLREFNKDKKIDMSGMKVGKLLILHSTTLTSHGNYKWLCQCECGGYTEVAQGHLSSSRGGVLSCGCYIKEIVSKTGSKFGGKNFIDLTGETFGWLKVMRRIPEIKKYPTYECECLLCGNKKIVKGKLLKNGKVSSCGCLKSVAEKETQIFLEQNDVVFETQYKFQDCRRVNPLPFDFAVFNNDKTLSFLIELDGIQHFEEQKNMSKLSYVQENDRIKSEYCNKNKIELLRIPYWEFKNKENLILNYVQVKTK